jgi:hypothetical protein
MKALQYPVSDQDLHYQKNSLSRNILLGYRPISYVNLAPQRAHGLRANAQETV